MERDLTGVDWGTGLLMFGIWLAVFGAFVWAHARIVKKAGYSGWNVLWMFVPIANVVMLFVFAFARWPIEDKVARLESKVF
jgi:hypothetical protein